MDCDDGAADRKETLFARSLGLFDDRPDHVLGQGIVRFQPRLLDLGGDVVLEGLLERQNERLAHHGEVLRLDPVRDVLRAELEHDLREELNVGSQHVEGGVEHLDEVPRVHQETPRRGERLGPGIDINREPEQNLGLGTLLEETTKNM